MRVKLIYPHEGRPQVMGSSEVSKSPRFNPTYANLNSGAGHQGLTPNGDSSALPTLSRR